MEIFWNTFEDPQDWTVLLKCIGSHQIFTHLFDFLSAMQHETYVHLRFVRIVLASIRVMEPGWLDPQTGQLMIPRLAAHCS